jgi:hypothetical protein
MSIKNFINARSSGQIATLLILVMVIMLIFILATVNIGSTSLKTITITNAADAAGLYLASQLGSRAQQLFTALGAIEQCESVSWLDTILAVVFAIVLVIVTVGAGAATLPALFAALGQNLVGCVVMGAIGGAAGGAVGGAIGGEDVGKSALAGASVGAAVGAGLSIGGAAMTGAEVFAPAGMMCDAGAYLSTPVWAAPLSVMAGGAVIGAAAASPMYNAYYIDNSGPYRVKKDFKELAEALSGMPDEDRIRESTFLLAFIQSVDDPRVTSHSRVVDCDGDGTRDVGDALDTDSDGDFNEEISCFQYWYYQRAEDLRVNFGNLRAVVDTFFNVTLANFITYAEGLYFNGGSLDRVAYNWSGDTNHSDGLLAVWARTLEEQNIFLYPGNTNRNIGFWRPGDSSNVVGVTEDCPTCTRAQLYYDDLDWAVKLLASEITMARELQTRMSIDQLTNGWEDWIDFFDDGNDASLSDFRDRLAQISTLGDAPDYRGMQDWRGDIANTRLALPGCISGPCPANVTYQICNPSCRQPAVGPTIPGSINYDQLDEFTPARDEIDNIRNSLAQFRAALRQLRNDLNTVVAARGDASAFGGKNPATYSWTDRQGDHSITVRASFVIPRVDQYTKNRTWYGSRDECVGIVPQAHSPTFTITRQDRDINRSLGILGNWNPFSGRIVRTCRGYWHYRPSSGSYVVDLSSTH